MNKEKKSKLIDFLSQFKNFENIGGLTIGGVIVEGAEDLAQAQALCAEYDFNVITFEKSKEQTVITEIVHALQQNRNVALAMLEITDEMVKFLKQVAENQLNLPLAGTDERFIANPLSERSRILLLMTNAFYADFSPTELLTRVCQI